MYVVARLMRESYVEVQRFGGFYYCVNVDLKMMDGMVGALPVFANLADAEAASENGRYDIVKIQAKEEVL